MCSMVAKSINARKEVRTNVVGLNKVSQYVLKHGVRKEQCIRYQLRLQGAKQSQGKGYIEMAGKINENTKFKKERKILKQ